MKKDYFILAFGNLRHRGVRSWLTILGIFIGIAAVVSLISLGAGLKTAVVGQFGTLSVDKLTIQNAGTGYGPPGSTVIEKLNEHDLKIIEKTQGVDMTVTRLVRVVEAKYKDEVKYNYLVDIPEDSKKLDLIYDSMNLKVSEGKLLNENDQGKLLLGKDIVTQFETDLKVGKNLQIQGKDFEIVGILDASSTFIINQAIIMPRKDMKDLLDIGDEFDIIIAQVEDQDEIEDVAEDIENRLRKDRNLKVGGEDFSVQTPLEALEAVTTILNIINLIVIGIALISLFVGGVGIMNTMYTSVLERKKEIGIMKAVGAENQDIMYLFLFESGLLGLVGGAIGAAIGLGFAYLAAGVANTALGTQIITVAFSLPLGFGAIAFAFLVGVISGVAPAIQASKLNVVDAIRGTEQ